MRYSQVSTEKIRKTAYRKIRYHWLVERIQYQLRRNPTLKLDLKKRDIEIRVSPGDVIIDCGANVGSVASLFARSGATVYAFEPNPLCFRILSDRFWALPSVKCFNQAVMDRNCKIILRTPAPHGPWDALDTTVASSITQGAMAHNSYAVNEVEVEGIDLDQFIRSLGTRILLLKLDVEGAEVSIVNRLLDTGTIDLVDNVLAETHEYIKELEGPTEMLRRRIETAQLARTKISLDWA